MRQPQVGDIYTPPTFSKTCYQVVGIQGLILKLQDTVTGDFIFESDAVLRSKGYAIRQMMQLSPPPSKEGGSIEWAREGDILYRSRSTDQRVIARMGGKLFVTEITPESENDVSYDSEPWLLDVSDTTWKIKPDPVAYVELDVLGVPTWQADWTSRAVGRLAVDRKTKKVTYESFQ